VMPPTEATPIIRFRHSVHDAPYRCGHFTAGLSAVRSSRRAMTLCGE